MGDPKQAAACFERAIELNPQFYEKAVENLRQARQALGNTANGTSASGSTDHVACP
jgi:tetratricopeptide (TPR) repeat protein